MSNGLTKRRPGGGGMGVFKGGIGFYDDYSRVAPKSWCEGTTTGRTSSSLINSYNNKFISFGATSKQMCVERWVFKDNHCIEVPTSHDRKAMALEYHMLPVMERWSHQKEWRYVQYNYLGRKDMRASAVPAAFKALQLIL